MCVGLFCHCIQLCTRSPQLCLNTAHTANLRIACVLFKIPNHHTNSSKGKKKKKMLQLMMHGYAVSDSFHTFLCIIYFLYTHQAAFCLSLLLLLLPVGNLVNKPKATAQHTSTTIDIKTAYMSKLCALIQLTLVLASSR